MKKHVIVLLTMGLATGSVHAADKAAASPWKSAVELGFIRTTGNTETTTTAAKADVSYEVEKWRHTGHAEGFGTQTQDDSGKSVVSAERYELSGKSDYKFTERDYVFGLVKLLKDRFSGFEYERVVSAGYGRTVIKRADMQLDIEIGPGVRFFKADNQSASDEATLRLSGNYWWAMSDHSKFTQELTTEIGEEFTTTKSITGISANISNALALKFTYTLRNKSKVPAGTERTDTELATTLVYNF